MKIPVAIIGGGPAGSASALWLRAHGIDSVIIEKARFPRYHIGESTTGECGNCIRALGLEEEMNRRKFPVKRAAAIYGTSGTKWALAVASRDKDWNLFPQSTWQVRRDEFDKMLLDTAIARGADFIHGQVAQPIVDDDGAVRGLTVRAADGGTIDIQSEMVLDCSGQHTFLANVGVTGPKFVGNYDKQMAIFSQVAGTIRDDTQGDTLLFYQKKHHWAWFIPLTDEIVSVGVITPAAYFKDEGRKQDRLSEARTARTQSGAQAARSEHPVARGGPLDPELFLPDASLLRQRLHLRGRCPPLHRSDLLLRALHFLEGSASRCRRSRTT